MKLIATCNRLADLALERLVATTGATAACPEMGWHTVCRNGVLTKYYIDYSCGVCCTQPVEPNRCPSLCRCGARH